VTGSGAAWCSKNSDARACIVLINDAGWTAPGPFCKVAPHSTQRTPRIACDRHQYQQQCAKEGAGRQRWRMGALSRGSPSEAVCVRAYMQAHTHFLVSRMCNTEAVVQNNCHFRVLNILEWNYEHQPLLGKCPDSLSPFVL